MRIWALLLAAGVALAAELPAPPETPKKPVTDDYSGVRVTDDYRWLENFGDPAAQAWSAAENQRARAYLDGLSLRKALLQRLTELYSDVPQRYLSLMLRGNLLFAIKRQPPKEQPLLVALSSIDDLKSERAVVDPNVLDPKGTTSIDFY